MLVLSRQKDESIVINRYILVTVVEIRGDKVRLGIEAPKDIPVHRQEIHDKILIEELGQQNEQAERGEVEELGGIIDKALHEGNAELQELSHELTEEDTIDQD